MNDMDKHERNGWKYIFSGLAMHVMLLDGGRINSGILCKKAVECAEELLSYLEGENE